MRFLVWTSGSLFITLQGVVNLIVSTVDAISCKCVFILIYSPVWVDNWNKLYSD